MQEMTQTYQACVEKCKNHSNISVLNSDFHRFIFVIFFQATSKIMESFRTESIALSHKVGFS